MIPTFARGNRTWEGIGWLGHRNYWIFSRVENFIDAGNGKGWRPRIYEALEDKDSRLACTKNSERYNIETVRHSQANTGGRFCIKVHVIFFIQTQLSTAKPAHLATLQEEYPLSSSKPLYPLPASATASISTGTPLGNSLTATQERAGL
jgi:hypothetical protein